MRGPLPHECRRCTLVLLGQWVTASHLQTSTIHCCFAVPGLVTDMDLMGEEITAASHAFKDCDPKEPGRPCGMSKSVFSSDPGWCVWLELIGRASMARGMAEIGFRCAARDSECRTSSSTFDMVDSSDGGQCDNTGQNCQEEECIGKVMNNEFPDELNIQSKYQQYLFQFQEYSAGSPLVDTLKGESMEIGSAAVTCFTVRQIHSSVTLP